MYFPEDYRWSAAVINVLGAGSYGAADIGEVDRIGRMLRGKEGDDAAWFDAWCEVAARVRALAQKADSTKHGVTAAAAYLRACVYYQMAERFRTPKDARALEAFRTSLECFRRFAALNTAQRIEPVEVPFEGKTLPGYFVHAQNTNAKRAPAVVFFDGLDVTKELQFTRGVADLVRHGMSVLVMDGPGTGEAIRLRGQFLRHDYEAAGSACFDWLAARAEVDPKRIGIMAISLGGYYAPRCAAMEPRFAACIAWGAQWDYHDTWKKRIDASFKTALSVPGHHIEWIMGAKSVDEALKKLEPFKLDGVMQKIRCPFLLVHGADDEQIPLADAQKQFDACGSKDKTFRVYTAEEGGAQHCQRDYLTLVVAEMWNWFDEKLNHA
jgi:dipeptidyl aminopeptidase/acylaminoacyl peptidase